MAKSKHMTLWVIMAVAAVVVGAKVHEMQATVSSFEELYADAPPFPLDWSDSDALARFAREGKAFNQRSAPIVAKDRHLTSFFRGYFEIVGEPYPGPERINYNSPRMRDFVRMEAGVDSP